MGTRFGVELRFYGDLGCAPRWIPMARMGEGDPVAVHMACKAHPCERSPQCRSAMFGIGLAAL